MMMYKGYKGEVVVDEDAGVLHGHVTSIRDVVTFEGTTVAEIVQAFHDSVDDYLAFCAELGQDPNGSDSSDVRSLASMRAYIIQRRHNGST